MKNTYRIEGDKVYIDIKCKGEMFCAIIDIDNLEKVLEFNGRWYGAKLGNTVYVQGNRKVGRNKYKFHRLHRWIFEPPEGYVVDHIDKNGLHNTSENIQIVTAKINMQNSKKFNRNTSNYKGVSFNTKDNNYQVFLQIKDKYKYIACSKNKDIVGLLSLILRGCIYPFSDERRNLKDILRYAVLLKDTGDI